MTDFSGRLVSYGLGLESTRGTVIDPQFWVQWESANFEDEGKDVLNSSALNVLDKYSGAAVVEQSGGGSLAGLVTDHTFGLILLAAFGGYSKAAHAGETTVYDHSFTESQLNASPSLTITRVDPNVQSQYAMAMLNSLDLEIKSGDYVKYTSAWMSQPSATATGKTPLPVVENTFISKNASVTFNGGQAVPVQSLKLTYTKGVAPYYIIGQNNPSNIYADSVELKGEMVLRYSDDTYKNYRFNNTPQSVVLTVANSGVTIGTAAHPGFTITMPQAFLTEWKADQSIDGIVNQTVSFQATYSLSTGTMVSATLTNTHTSYNPAGVS